MTGGISAAYPYRGACANYLCAMYGCQGYCRGSFPQFTVSTPVVQPGCICPPGSEKTCQALICYRRGPTSASGIAAATAGETTQIGSTEGKSPAPKDDAQPQPGPSQ